MNNVSSQILARLLIAKDFLSGEELCREFGITRSAVWKHICLLRSEGYSINSATNRGYRLIGLTGRAVYVEVKPFLETLRFGRNFFYFPITNSTNLQAKMLADKGAIEGTVVVADAQTGGRGRMGRAWVSPSGSNLYFSLILRPEVPSIRVPQLTLLVAVAIHQALTVIAYPLLPMIKWPNDIFANGKKLCGVLCEMYSEPDLTHFVVVGIGINVNHSLLPTELHASATSLYLETGRLFSRPELLATVLNHFELLYQTWLLKEDLRFVLPYIEKYSLLKSKFVSVEQCNRCLRGTVTGIAKGGELKLESADGQIVFVSSGEVRISKKIT
ncbi:MAG: biotin--[acetyl-CoA-carboxylase] ligase [Chlorobiaceae bacterium]